MICSAKSGLPGFHPARVFFRVTDGKNLLLSATAERLSRGLCTSLPCSPALALGRGRAPSPHVPVCLGLCCSFLGAGRAGERRAPCPDCLLSPQASVSGDGSLGGAQRGSAAGSCAVRHCLCSRASSHVLHDLGGSPGSVPARG